MDSPEEMIEICMDHIRLWRNVQMWAFVVLWAALWVGGLFSFGFLVWFVMVSMLGVLILAWAVKGRWRWRLFAATLEGLE